MEYLRTFVATFSLIFVIYYFYYILFSRRGRNCPVEATYLIRLYKLDINRFSYRKFIFHVSLVTSIDIALVTTIVTLFDKLIWQILFGLVTVIPVIAISFILIGKYYQKKQLKDNTKELLKEDKHLKKQQKFELKLFEDEGRFKLFKKKKKGQDKNDKRK